MPAPTAVPGRSSACPPQTERRWRRQRPADGGDLRPDQRRSPASPCRGSRRADRRAPGPILAIPALLVCIAGSLAAAANEAVRLDLASRDPVSDRDPPLILFLARDADAGSLRAIARAPYASSACLRVDAAGLRWADGRIEGAISVTHPAVPDGKGSSVPPRTWTVAIAARRDGGAWSGTCERGARREPLSGRDLEAEDPVRADAELVEVAIHAGQTAKAHPAIVLRMECAAGAVVRACAYATDDAPAGMPRLADASIERFSLDGSRLACAGAIVPSGGRASSGERWPIRIEASIIGRQGGGDAAFGAVAGTCLVRRTPLSGALPPPVALHAAAWTAGFSARPDPALVEAARVEARSPIRPAGSASGPFWNWRLRPEIAAIAVPTLPWTPVPGAAAYLQTWKAKGGARTLTATVPAPWATPADLWDELAPGPWSVEVTALDAQGHALAQRPQRFRRTRLDLAERAREPGRKPKTPDEPEWIRRGLAGGEPDPVPAAALQVVKLPPFQGPYHQLPADWPRRIDRAARAAAEYPSLLASRGLGMWHEPQADGDHGVQREVPGAIFAWLAASAADPAQLPEAEDAGMALLAGVRPKSGLLHTYQGHTDIRYRGLACLIDLAVATASPAWRQRAIDHAAALCRFQKPDGSWTGIDAGTGKQHKPDGFFDAELIDFCPAQILWQLGRLRVLLGHDGLRSHEERAHAYLRASSLITWEWPNQGYHSMTLGYPYRLAGQNPLAYAFYLMECADPDARDPLLIADLLRWCEDIHVDWSRTDPQPGAAACPRLRAAGDSYRSEGYPIRMAAWQALAWAQLHRLTRTPLHRAKAEAFVAAALAAQDAASGVIDWQLRTGGSWDGITHRFADNHGEAILALRRCAQVLAASPAP